MKIPLHPWWRNGSYETANGIQADETGILKKASSPETSDVITAQGNGILKSYIRFEIEKKPKQIHKKSNLISR